MNKISGSKNQKASLEGIKPRVKTPDSLRREASQAAGAAPTLRYGPAGDSAPRLRFKAAVPTARMSK